MSVFISYARRDEGMVRDLERDVARTGREVWIDRHLTGGQAWWDTILAEIRRCEVFVIALSPASVKSKACGLELGYAIALAKTILPVMVADVEITLAPPIVAHSQVIRYTERTADAVLDLTNALTAAPPSPLLPPVLPVPPEIPMASFSKLQDEVMAPSITFENQRRLVGELRVHVQVDETRAAAVQLLEDLRRRPDIVELIAREVDALLASLRPRPQPDHGSAEEPAAPHPAPAWHPDPWGRFDQRYWNGAEWSAHVARGGQQLNDPPGERSTPAVPAAPLVQPPAAYLPAPQSAYGLQVHATPGAFSAGAYAGLIVASLFTAGIVGVIVGWMNVRNQARKSQALTLLIGGAIWFLLVASSADSFGPPTY